MTASRARAVLELDVTGVTISRHLYGHFAEHLGRCIYGGFYVGEGSPIPNQTPAPVTEGSMSFRGTLRRERSRVLAVRVVVVPPLVQPDLRVAHGRVLPLLLAPRAR
jgi:hypothetical protein